MSTYKEFLHTKAVVWNGQSVDIDYVPHSVLFPFQAKIIQLALEQGRYAVFADTGLGKTIMQIELARVIAEATTKPQLIVAPLGVTHQTIKQAEELFGIEIKYAQNNSDINFHDDIYITNYERLDKFDPSTFGGLYLDESSILKSIAGKTKTKLIQDWACVPYRFAFTATPAPNDVAEMANHAAFLGVMSREEMLAKFFVHDDKGWRLRKHGREGFYRWVSSWSITLKLPSDIGDYSDDGYILPKINYIPVIVDHKHDMSDGKMFNTGLKGISDRAKVRKVTMADKVNATLDIVAKNPDEQFLIWGWFNAECDKLGNELPDSVQVAGKHKPNQKLERFQQFLDGEKHLITKPKIAGFGMNFQHCHNMIFCGISDSWEIFYQSIRRQWRFGQDEKVNVWIVFTEIEQAIYDNIIKKGERALDMGNVLIKEIQSDTLKGGHQSKFEYETDTVNGTFQEQSYKLMKGDSCERMNSMDDCSIDLSVYSPPFVDLYTYTPTERDLGNSSDSDTFFNHYKYIIRDLLRITKPGRVTAVHVADIPAMLGKDGYIGLKDFSGDVIRAYIAEGWIFDGRIPIDKNQQAQSIRTHSKALTMTQMKKDRVWLRPALPDYILKFRKDGENQIPVRGGMDGDGWIELANPIWPGVFEDGEEDRAADSGMTATWYNILESDTLQGFQKARHANDERHVCPLQLGTIERCIRLWTNPDETVFTPFMGIGSEVYQALRMGRDAIGCELKPSYFDFAVKNMKILNIKEGQRQMF